ncbi:MAG: glycosyltransferase [Verrucomicrobia bacterium]|nr:glycosyltransferase [Verrucomicrobiota bacterium]MBV9274239.1 glycosyltransferase [Verrucomicrobiota bacterium]
MAAKVDLHLHSRFSDRSAEWLFRRFDFPDSYSAPRSLHRRLKEKGMTFVTFTDHNRIDGCLEIAELPGAFISVEVGAEFPDDHVSVHLLAWNITELQHREIQQLRRNIFELQEYLTANQISHAVAHPFYDKDRRLTADHVQKLILLFKHFEGVNGLRDTLLSEVARFVFRSLTPELIDQFADRQRLEPTHEEPWRKVLLAGSDDHAGIFPGSAYTETPTAKAVTDFLQFIDRGQCVTHGVGGTPLVIAHGLYNTAYQFAKDKFSATVSPNLDFLEVVISRFLEGKNPTQFTIGEKIGLIFNGILSGKIFELAKPANLSIWPDLANYFGNPDVQAQLAKETEGVNEPERRAFLLVATVFNQLGFRFFDRFVQQITSGNVMEAVQTLSALLPLGLLLGPYFYGYHSQAPSRARLTDICLGTVNFVPDVLQNSKRAWFTDTLEDVNGVTTTIRKMTAAGLETGADLIVVTSRQQIGITDIPIKNFIPIGDFELPEYELQKLSFPPVLHMIDYIQRERFTELIISTPGPVGLTALLAAKILDIRATGIYHTDFPQYVRILTQDNYMETLAWNFMQWFYSQVDLVYVNSELYRQRWIDRGIAPEKLKIFPRGIDTQIFNPELREPKFWAHFGKEESEVGLLYVGRISKEKNLDIAVKAVAKLRAEKLPVRLLFVGDGPYLKQLRQMAPDACYTGYLKGRELGTAYASSDIFIFPSTTDTFGNVVLEAQAAGLPCVVSDQGGPAELVVHGIDGFITRSLNVDAFADAIRKLAVDCELRLKMGDRARQRVQDRNWANAFRQFWNH